MVPFKLNYTVGSIQSILNITMDVDMLAHFDRWQREGYDNQYEAQDQWPVELRRARLVPAVDYIQVTFMCCIRKQKEIVLSRKKIEIAEVENML
jgi:hypothetical protein